MRERARRMRIGRLPRLFDEREVARAIRPSVEQRRVTVMPFIVCDRTPEDLLEHRPRRLALGVSDEQTAAASK
jgi:hypothetical protein